MTKMKNPPLEPGGSPIRHLRLNANDTAETTMMTHAAACQFQGIRGKGIVQKDGVCVCVEESTEGIIKDRQMNCSLASQTNEWGGSDAAEETEECLRLKTED